MLTVDKFWTWLVFQWDFAALHCFERDVGTCFRWPPIKAGHWWCFSVWKSIVRACDPLLSVTATLTISVGFVLTSPSCTPYGVSEINRLLCCILLLSNVFYLTCDSKPCGKTLWTSMSDSFPESLLWTWSEGKSRCAECEPLLLSWLFCADWFSWCLYLWKGTGGFLLINFCFYPFHNLGCV